MADADDYVNLTRADNDLLRDVVADQQAAGLHLPPGALGGVHRGEELLAVIRAASGEIGYYPCDFYHFDPMLCDASQRMSSSKLGISNRSRIRISATAFLDGYGASLDETTATEHLLSIGQIFLCRIIGPNRTAAGGGDGKPVALLIGNPIGMACEDD